MYKQNWLQSDLPELAIASKLLLVSKCVLAMVDFIYGAVYIILMNNRGLSALEISLVISISTCSLFFLDFPTGIISDKFGRKLIASIGIIIWGGSLILFLFAKKFLDFLFCELILQFGIALVSGNFQTWFYDLSKKYNQDEFRKKILLKIGVIIQLFSIFGSAIGSLITVIGINTIYTISGFTMIFLGIVCMFVGEDNHSKTSEKNNIIVHLISTMKEFITSPLTLMLIPFEFLMKYSTFSFMLGWQLYYINFLHLPESYIGLLLIVFMVAMLIGKKLSTIFYNQINIHKIILLAIFLIMIGFITMFLFKTVYGFILSAILVEIGIGLFNNVQEIWLLSIIPSDNISTFYSGIGTIDEIFILIASVNIGFIIEYSGMRSLWIISACMMGLNIIYFMYLLKSNKISG